MALPRRVLPSRVPLPSEAASGAPAPVGITTPASPPPAPAPSPVVEPIASADLTALGALMAEGPAPAIVPVAVIASTPVIEPVAVPAVAPVIAEAAPVLPAPASQPVAVAEPIIEPIAEPATIVTAAPLPPASAPVAPPQTPVSAPVTPDAAPQNVAPSRPDDNPLRRRVRQPRAFTFTPPAAEKAPATLAAAPDQPPQPAGTPVGLADTTPLDQVDDRLQAAGILPLPESDALTAALPPSVASIPVPESQPTLLVEPTVLVTPVIESQPEPEPAPLPVAPPLPAPIIPTIVAAPLVSTVAEAAPPAPAMATSSLPWATPMPAVPATAAPEGASWNQPWGNLPPTSEATVSAPPAPQPTPDVYSFHGGPQVGPFAQAQGSGGNHLPPPPSLPSQYSSKAKNSGGQGGGGGSKGGNWQLGLAAAVVVAALFGAYQLVSRKQASPAQLALQTPAATTGNSSTALLPPPAPGSNGLPANNLFAGGAVSGTTGVSDSNVQIGFADVPADQANKPIVADGSEKMPSDVGFVAQLQTAISKEQAKKNADGSTAVPALAATAPTASSADKAAATGDLKAQLATELAAYRKALANTPPGEPAPKPAAFMGKAGSMSDSSATLTTDATPVTGPNGELLPPPQLAGGTGQGGGLLPPAELYKNNPKSLPVVPEPTAAAEPKIRQLTDFNVSMFAAPEHDRVRMPSGIKPRFSTTDFPQMDVLSFVPGKGVIAYHDGKEGVLLLGESIDGWQLNRVNPDNAEFKNGQRSQYVTAE